MANRKYKRQFKDVAPDEAKEILEECKTMLRTEVCEKHQIGSDTLRRIQAADKEIGQDPDYKRVQKCKADGLNSFEAALKLKMDHAKVNKLWS